MTPVSQYVLLHSYVSSMNVVLNTWDCSARKPIVNARTLQWLPWISINAIYQQVQLQQQPKSTQEHPEIHDRAQYSSDDYFAVSQGCFLQQSVTGLSGSFHDEEMA